MQYLKHLLFMFFLHRRLPSNRAVSAYFKVRGLFLQKRWPYVSRQGASTLNIEDLLAFEASRAKRLSVMSIGAFDGVENDPLSQFIRSNQCDAVLIEPQTRIFERLKNNYKDFPHFKLINKAIDEKTGERPFYIVSNIAKQQPEWVEQLASFDESHIEKHEHLAPGVSKNIRTEIVSTISFDDLCSDYEIKDLNVLQIDAEGLDEKIISWIPFNLVKPRLIIFEIAHMSDAAKRTTNLLLQKKGYRIFPMNTNLDAAAVLL